MIDKLVLTMPIGAPGKIQTFRRCQEEATLSCGRQALKLILLTHILSEVNSLQGGGSWQVHYTDEGRAYYHNSLTGQTQWEVPQNGT